MPTTEQVILQVRCQACNKSMSGKSLKYSHAAYCIKRLQEVDKPRTIPVSKKSMRNLMKLLPAQGVQPDEEVYAEEEENLKGSGIPSDDIELDAMTNIKHQTTKAQYEYMINNNIKPDLPMYKVNEASRPEDIIPPTYEVRMKSARQKKQSKYDKLMLKAF